MARRDRSNRVRSEKERIANRERMRREYSGGGRERNLKYKAAHRAELLEKARLRRETHHEENIERMRLWRESHREEARQYARRRYYSDIEQTRRQRRERATMLRSTAEGRIEIALRGRLYKAVVRASKAESTKALLGCSISELKKHLESQFKPGMSWDNYRYNGWHVDHIIPCSAFDLSDPDQQRACFHWSNLQPLWAKENLSKGQRIEMANLARECPA